MLKAPYRTPGYYSDTPSSCTCVLLRLLGSGLCRLSPAPVSGRLEPAAALQCGAAPVTRRRRLRCCAEVRRRIPLVLPRHDRHSAARVSVRFRSDSSSSFQSGSDQRSYSHINTNMCCRNMLRYTRACAFTLRHFRPALNALTLDDAVRHSPHRGTTNRAKRPKTSVILKLLIHLNYIFSAFMLI